MDDAALLAIPTTARLAGREDRRDLEVRQREMAGGYECEKGLAEKDVVRKGLHPLSRGENWSNFHSDISHITYILDESPLTKLLGASLFSSDKEEAKTIGMLP